MPADPKALAEILGLDTPLQVADIGAADIAEAPPYRVLLDAGLARLNAFDADVRQHEKLRATYGEALALFTDIIGDGTQQTLHLASPASGMTSLLKPDARRLEFFNGFDVFGQVQGTEPVQTTRLDDVAGLPDLDFLKMDIQGGELQALEHGQARLARCAMIHLEVSFVPLYEGQPSFGEIDVWMRAHGFIPHRFTEVKRWSVSPITRNSDIRTPFNQLLEADIVYARDLIDPGLDATLLKKTALLAHACYDSPDLAGHIIARLEVAGQIAGGAFAKYLGVLGVKT
ncbi:FkbM family methyltransferase [Phenylobacterium sp.]|uniref:FkbM family methyltransferase n=1 Tax=Phenylobacterium sp. TaxID=1871053 RepID=UPI002C6311B9|nr:FkbM family methyltransferase [Phenylobacterium sp.]HLZ76606.1 FkbM family methyltransferase [Phenylobacterium sp.]